VPKNENRKFLEIEELKMSLMDISSQSKKILHIQPITVMISATSPHFTPPS
jgi:hypothetical protein